MKQQKCTYCLAVLTVIIGMTLLLASPASAGTPTVIATGSTTGCTSFCLTFTVNGLATNYNGPITGSIHYTVTLTSTTGGSPITVEGDVSFATDGTKQICGDWISGGAALTDNYDVAGTAVLTTSDNQTVNVSIDFGGSNQLACGSTPTGKTFSISNSMEGDLSNIRPGDWISGGYSFKFTSSNHAATTYTVTTSVKLPVYCPDGGGSGGNIFIPLGTQTFNIAAGDTNWHRTGDQNSILAWEGAVQAPDLCSGNRMRNQIGATFTATVLQDPHVDFVDWRFHYRDPAAKGKPNTNCTDATDPNRNRADVCGASWSQTFRDP
jgi:hypothetical protein